MRFLAIDASTKSCGWAVYENNELIDYGCLTSSFQLPVKRIIQIIDGLRQVIEYHDIKYMVLEEVRPEDAGGSIQTHRVLLWLQGAIANLLYTMKNSTNIQFIYPSEWRSFCGIKTGRGIKREELKQADINFVKEKYNIDVNDDIADAIGIGYGFVKKLTEDKAKKGVAWGKKV